MLVLRRVRLLEHVVAHHRRRELDYVRQYVYGGRFRGGVVHGERDLERGEDAQAGQRLEERLPALRLQGLREGAELFQEEHEVSALRYLHRLVRQVGEQLV